MLARIDDSVSIHLRDKLRELLHYYSDVFSKDEWDLEWTNVVTHRIDTGDHEPVRQPFRRYPPAFLQAIDRHVTDMQRQGIIKPAWAPGRLTLFWPKKWDAQVLRRLPPAERRYPKEVPLPRTDDCLDAMSGFHWFSTFDLRSSYHQVALDPSDVDKTAFITRRGMYRFRIMPFGLCNTGATFQRLMDLTYRTQPKSVPCLPGRHYHPFPYTRTTPRPIGTSSRAPQKSQLETETKQVLLDAGQGELPWTRHLR